MRHHDTPWVSSGELRGVQIGENVEATQKPVLNRLRRAQVQSNAVSAAIENGGERRDVVTQPAAVSSALDKSGFPIISTAMQKRTADEHDESDPMTVKDLETLFMSLA